MSSGKIEQANRLRDQSDQLVAEVKEEDKKRIKGMRDELKKAERDFNKTYGIKPKPKSAKKGKAPEKSKASSNPLMDEEILRIYENGLQRGITDVRLLQGFLDPQLKRQVGVINKVVEAWNMADRDERSSAGKFLSFLKSS